MWKNTSTSSPQPTAVLRTQSPPATPPRKLKHQGRRFAQIVKLKPEFADVYKECHANVWPQVLKQIKDCNIEDCKCDSVPASSGAPGGRGDTGTAMASGGGGYEARAAV